MIICKGLIIDADELAKNTDSLIPVDLPNLNLVRFLTFIDVVVLKHVDQGRSKLNAVPNRIKSINSIAIILLEFRSRLL